jgi:selenocysteine lyase/cysteine desulfurase
VDVVFAQNATTGINAVVQSVVKTLKSGDAILMTSLAYGT